MAEAKEKTITKASSNKAAGEKTTEKKITEAKPSGNATGLRVGAVILWLCAIGFEVLALLILGGKVNLLPKNPGILWIPALVLDLVCVIIGSQLWKKANRIKPASKKNAALFWLWNNMGLIACTFAFLPFIILVLRNKNLDKKTRTIAVVAAVVALLVGGLCSYDFDPVSAEDKAEAAQTITSNVYWTNFGKVYHIDTDCQALTNSTALTEGTVEQAIEANRTRLCSFCAKKHDISNLATDGATDTNSKQPE